MKTTTNLMIGNRAKANHYIDTIKDGVTLYRAYDSEIALVDRKSGIVKLGRNWDVTNTTKRHLYAFLAQWLGMEGLNGKKMQAIVDAGELITPQGRKYKVSVDESMAAPVVVKAS